jgi:ABC-2 type transport system ATP-binding protein
VARIPMDPRLDAVVEFSHVFMRMPRRRRRRGSGRRQRLRRIAGEARREEVDVLLDVSFRVEPGDAVAVMGSNGPGRQTLLRLVSGTLRPDAGEIRRREAIVPMIEVARSFERTYSIRQNIYLVGGLLGMTPTQVEEHLPHIVETSEITISLDRYLGAAPALVRQKLAWSIAMSVDARAYAIDRTIVVGDAAYREQCWAHVEALREKGASFIVATDAPRLLRRFCSRGLVIGDGRIVIDSPMDEAVAVARDLRQTSRRSGEEPA